MNPEVEARWTALRNAVTRDVGDGPAVARIPTWPPTTLDEALEWARSSVYEGWYVTHHVERAGGSTTLWLKVWEYGDDEPTWAAVKATPIASTKPGNEFW
jgi:hypothetical protein